MIKKRPLVSLVLFSYNQAAYIEQAINSVLGQTYQPLEIIISDDCSSDNTFDIIKRVVSDYEGPQKIILNKNKINLGLIGHVNKAFEMANGEIVVFAAGDDISLPNRVQDVINIFERDPSIFSISMRYRHMSVEGIYKDSYSNAKNGVYDLNDLLKSHNFPKLGCTRAYRKEVFSIFGDLNSDCGVEDSNLVFRAILLGSIYHLDELGVYYRSGHESLSATINLDIFYGILTQRERDSQIALDQGLISQTAFEGIKKENARLYRKCEAIDKNSNAKIKFIGFLRYVIFNRSFKYNEKLMQLKSSVYKDLNLFKFERYRKG